MISERRTLRLGHSPDPDDAYMWWPLFERAGEPPRLQSDRFRFEAIVEDIEKLNERACQSEAYACLEITGISCACYPLVEDRYVITACGASLGDGYGPKLVAREPRGLDSLRNKECVIAVPGVRTTAFLVTSLMLGKDRFRWESMPFDEIPDAVASGKVDAGVVIHEGQLTFESDGLFLVQDLGVWWGEETGLPLPLGANVIRRDLDERFGSGAEREVVSLLERSLRLAMSQSNREESIVRAQEFSRGQDAEITSEFVDLYVNSWTIDFGEIGRHAVKELLARAADADLVQQCRQPEFVGST